MIHEWQDSLEAGRAGELQFMESYKRLDPVFVNRPAWDFVLFFNWQRVELKTDRYRMRSTPNFFFEHVTEDWKGQKPGGPWRASYEGVEWFVYYYINDGVWFWMNPSKLANRLDALMASGQQLTLVQNDGWRSKGLLVPRDLVREWNCIERSPR